MEYFNQAWAMSAAIYWMSLGFVLFGSDDRLKTKCILSITALAPLVLWGLTYLFINLFQATV